MELFKQDRKKAIEDAYKRGYEKAEKFLLSKFEVEKQKIIDDFNMELWKLKLEISSQRSDVEFYKQNYEMMKKNHSEVMAKGLTNQAITSRLLHYAKEKSLIEPNMLQQFGILERDANNNILEDKK
jgi:hypothetical protein